MYPYNTLTQQNQPFPLFGNTTSEPPQFFDLSFHNQELANLNLQDQEQFQQYLEEKMENGNLWGVSGYLEYRSTLLGHLPQMRATNRFFHLGLDIIVPLDAPLYAPLDGTVFESGYEEETGNYGGYVVLQHETDNNTFYSLYGHLNPNTIPEQGTHIDQGKTFAKIGDFHQNGNWFYHTHLQVITERGREEGYIHKGYCTAEDLPEMPYLCPSPLFLFRY